MNVVVYHVRTETIVTETEHFAGIKYPLCEFITEKLRYSLEIIEIPIYSVHNSNF